MDVEKIKYNYAIYHKNCLDGFSSLIVLLKSKRLTKDAIIYYDVPSASFPPKGIDNKDIIIMDVAYKYDVLRGIINRAKSVVFIDHHVTISEDVKKLRSMYKDKIKIIYDESESGASLTWEFLFEKQKVPLFIKYIKDNDIGAWKLRHTKPFIYALRVKYDLDVKYENIQKWKELFEKSKVKKLVKLGEIYEEYAERLLEENVRKYSMEAFPSEKLYEEFTEYFNKPGQYRVAVVCGSGCPSTSLLGNKMMEVIDCDFALLWSYHMDRKEYILAFRSKETDVGNIAKIFGGGGHKLASACSFPASKYHIQDIFLENSLPRKNR